MHKIICLQNKKSNMEYDIQPHINLAKIDKICILSGNPDRIPIISNYLVEVEKLSDHRGLVSYRGKTKEKKVPVTLLTTGMGGPSTAIVIEEAYKAGGRYFIRIGSCGSLQPGEGNGIGTIFIPFGAVRDEGTSPRIIPIEFPAVASPSLYQKLREAASELDISTNTGIVWTSDIYYNDDRDYFKKWSNLGATYVEMESSVIFAFTSKKYPHLKSATILTSDGNLNEDSNIYSGDKSERNNKFNKGVEKSILIALRAIEKI